MNKLERERHLKESMETNRGTFKPALEDQYKIWLDSQNHPEKEKDLSKMSPRHRNRLLKKGQLKQIK